MTVRPVGISAAPPDPCWRAPGWPGWSCDYLVWPLREDGEAGPPQATMQRIAAALAAAALAVFPAAADGAHPDAVLPAPRALRRQGAAGRLRIVCSRDPDEIATLFDQAGFDWTQRGQLVLLFGPQTRCGDVSPEWLFAAMADGTAPAPPCLGVMRPGTDGDFAELDCRDADLRGALLHALGGIA